MITVEKRPAQIAFAGNPLRYQVVSDAQYISPGTRTILELHFLGLDSTIGHNFQLSFMNMVLDFAISNGSNDLGLSIPPATSTDTLSSWSAKVGAAMAMNYYIHTYYDLVILGIDFFFIAKDFGAVYTMTYTNVNVIGISSLNHLPGVDTVVHPGFGVIAQVLDDQGVILGEDFRPVDSAGRIKFDLSDYLNSSIENFTIPHFTIPGTIDKLKSFIDGMKSYQVAFCEKYDGVIKKVWIEDFRSVVMGGLSREGLVKWNDGNAFWDSVTNQQRFLTWCPSGKLTTQNQLERLYFLNVANVTLTLNYRVFFTDGSNQNISSQYSATANSIIEIQVGYEDLDLGYLQPLKQVMGWNVWLNSGQQVISEVYNFNIDQTYKEYDRQFLFRNSFGWYDVMRATGKVNRILTFVKTEGYAVVEDFETVLNSPDRNFFSFETQTFTATTGWVTKQNQEWLRDFLISREVYEIIDGLLYPIKITSKKSTQGKDGDYNLSLDFEYARAYKDLYYSKSGNSEGENSGSITWDSVEERFDDSLITFDQTQY